MQTAYRIVGMPPSTELGQTVYRIDFEEVLTPADKIRHVRWLDTYEYPLTIVVADNRKSITVGLKDRTDQQLALLRWLTQNSQPHQHYGEATFYLQQTPPTVRVEFADGGSDDDLWGVASVLMGHEGVLTATVSHGICTAELHPELAANSPKVWAMLNADDVKDVVSFNPANEPRR